MFGSTARAGCVRVGCEAVRRSAGHANVARGVKRHKKKEGKRQKNILFLGVRLSIFATFELRPDPLLHVLKGRYVHPLTHALPVRDLVPPPGLEAERVTLLAPPVSNAAPPPHPFSKCSTRAGDTGPLGTMESFGGGL